MKLGREDAERVALAGGRELMLRLFDEVGEHGRAFGEARARGGPELAEQLSVDTKKKELVGDFNNGGREWRPKGDPVEVRTHDFKDNVLGKVNPYGVYDLAADEGWVAVGIDADTAEFAVASIQSWWQQLGKARYPVAATLTITADCGGSNG